MKSLPELKNESVCAIVAAVLQMAPTANKKRTELIRLLAPNSCSMLKLSPPENDPLAIEKAALLAVIYDETFTPDQNSFKFYTEKMKEVSEHLGICWDDVFSFSRSALSLRQLLFS